MYNSMYDVGLSAGWAKSHTKSVSFVLIEALNI